MVQDRFRYCRDPFLYNFQIGGNCGTVSQGLLVRRNSSVFNFKEFDNLKPGG